MYSISLSHDNDKCSPYLCLMNNDKCIQYLCLMIMTNVFNNPDNDKCIQ